ncbi:MULTISPECIES: hypothetical protein [unclassified Streptomyces]|uniref:hypothetical protein n=1 Tax=unclassified Streptomyces TaxID=2593676 RepID=UPI0036EC3B12
MSPQPRRLPLACLVLTPLLLATGCSGGSGESKVGSGVAVTAAPAAGVVAPAKVEVIAGLVGCKATIRTDADELREGVCHGKDGDLLITTFPEERLKVTWLDAASVYGGTYLVGTRWVVSAPAALLKKVRPELGGSIRQL